MELLQEKVKAQNGKSPYKKKTNKGLLKLILGLLLSLLIFAVLKYTEDRLARPAGNNYDA
jgi:hypothetical protein